MDPEEDLSIRKIKFNLIVPLIEKKSQQRENVCTRCYGKQHYKVCDDENGIWFDNFNIFLNIFWKDLIVKMFPLL